jgi:DNA-binding protein
MKAADKMGKFSPPSVSEYSDTSAANRTLDGRLEPILQSHLSIIEVFGMAEKSSDLAESVENAIESQGSGREPRKAERKAGKSDNVVFVGKKPTMSYVLAVITQFSEGNSEVFVKARGRSISTAIDVVEVTKKKFMHDLKSEIETDTEVITDERNQRINVSTLSARLFKPG